MITVEFAARCAALRHRGLSVELMHDLQVVGDEALLVRLEDASDTYLSLMSSLDQERRAAATMLGVERVEPKVQIWNHEQGDPRCPTCGAPPPPRAPLEDQ